MVHALRLLWFLLYGSYPTGHGAMAKALSSDQGARANWGRDSGVPPGKAAIYLHALKGAIADGLKQPTLADRLPKVGTILASAISLREDANYESLILARQYLHPSLSAGGPGWIDVVVEFKRATIAMAKAGNLVLEFMEELVSALFDDGREWYCPQVPFQAKDLLHLLFNHVRSKIDYYYTVSKDEERPEDSPDSGLDPWAGSLKSWRGLLNVPRSALGDARRLIRFSRFGNFQMKRGMMAEFQEKVHNLRDAIGERTAEWREEES
jgi:hypothetical protein